METAPSSRRTAQRRGADRRTRKDPIPFPDRRLSRSAYEQVFLKLVSADVRREDLSWID